MRLKVITFVKKYAPYNTGETAGFLPHIAESFITAGIAVAGARRVDGASVKALDPTRGERAGSDREWGKGDRVAFFVKGEGDQFGEIVKVDKKATKATVRVGPEAEFEVDYAELSYKGAAVELV
jgi:hypothetical protein